MTDLTDRMRTCVAGLETIEISITLNDPQMEAIIDARALLIAAAEELEKPIEVRLGEPMAKIEAVAVAIPPMTPQWTGGDMKIAPAAPLGKSACPNCDSRTTKTVHVKNKRIVLECPVCGHEWRH